MKILLVNPRCNYDFLHKSSSVMLPNNLLMLAAYGRLKGHDFRVLDMNLDEALLLPTLKEWLPDIVGVTVMTGPSLKNAVALSQLARKTLPAAKIVWGGVHPTLLAEQVLQNDFVDVAVIGDGEETLVDLADSLTESDDISGVVGIAYQRDNNVYFTRPRSLLDNLDKMPDPAWNLLDIERYSQLFALTLNTSRGCPFRCTFCYNKAVNGNRRAALSAERVYNQILYLNEAYGVKEVNFLEDNFMAEWKRVEEFCSLMIKSGLSVKWSCEGRMTGATSEYLMLMKEAGCISLRFGVESASPRILEFLKKDITRPQIEQVLGDCRKARLKATIYLIIGIPTETKQDRDASLQFLKEFPEVSVDITIYRPYPGTELFDYCVRQGLFIQPSKTIEWARISDQYDPRFYVNKNNSNDIHSYYLRFSLHNYRQIIHAQPRLRGIINYAVYTLPLRVEQLSLFLHIPRRLLTEPAQFLVSSLYKLYCLFKKVAKIGAKHLETQNSKRKAQSFPVKYLN